MFRYLNNSSDDMLYYPLISTILLGARIKWDTNYINEKLKNKERKFHRFFKILILTSLFMMLIAIFLFNNMLLVNKNGESVSVKESAYIFFNVDDLKKLNDGFIWTWNFYKVHGLEKLTSYLFYHETKISQINAYKVGN